MIKAVLVMESIPRRHVLRCVAVESSRSWRCWTCRPTHVPKPWVTVVCWA